MELKKAYGIVHCHSDNSLKDASQSVYSLVERAVEMEEPCVVLTDHGVLTGAYELLHAAEKVKKKTGKSIKVVPGVEAYFSPKEGSRLRHLLLIPKDGTGYKAIMRAVTESNKQLERGIPTMTGDLLVKLFGPAAPAHGHVIATSACVGGVLAQVLRDNQLVDAKIEKIRSKMEKEVQAKETDDDFKGIVQRWRDLSSEVSSLEEKKLVLEEKKKKSRLVPLRRAVKAFKEATGDYFDAVRTLEETEKEVAEAEADLPGVKAELKDKKKALTAAEKEGKAYRVKISKWQALEKEIEETETARADETTLYNRAIGTAKKFQSIFGKENFFIELQYHGLDIEKETMPKLVRIAREIGAPLSAANDAHFTRNTPEDVYAMRLARFLRFEKWNPREDDGEYYLKSASEIVEWLSKILPRKTAIEAMEGTELICQTCGDVFAELRGAHYPVYVSDSGESAKERLRRLAVEGISEKYPGAAWTELHQKRLDYELDTIEKMGFSNYLCIVQDFVQYGRMLGVQNEDKVGLGIGPGRGSAVGSLVCYLSGITAVDPIKYDLLFERFLNPERVSMPDIDVDFRTDLREECINYVRKKYGVICGIVTKSKNQAKNAIKMAARAYGDEKYGNTSAFLDLAQKIADEVDRNADLKESGDLLKVNYPDEDSVHIIESAKVIQGLTYAYGVHAAGVVISDCGDVGSYVPLMFNTKKDQWICQATKEEVEGDAGLLKMDFLGLRNLDIITDALRRIKRNTGKSIDIEKIQEEPEVLKHIFADAKTDSVFQFESSGMKNILSSFAPSSLEDLILLVAAYRPGPMEKIPLLIDVKFGRKPKDYIFPEMGQVLDTTYGYPIYQEQVQEIFHRFAGFSLGEADIVRRAMAKKHIEILTNPETKYKERFIQGMLSYGATQERAEAFWEDILAFASYAFNKSHAAAYAYISYYTGWLKYHYPLEYMTAVLNYTPDNAPKLIADCREMGISVLPPDVNRSEHGFADNRASNTIRVGFSAIKGMGTRDSVILEERKNGRFKSVQDFFLRVPLGSLSKDLALAGAFDAWIKNRRTMAQEVSALKDLSGKILVRRRKIDDLLSNLPSEEGEERSKAGKKIDELKKEISVYNIQFSTCFRSTEFESKADRLFQEKQVLGFYVSGSPIDSYPSAKKVRTTAIADAKAGNAVICGVIEQVEVKRRKKDGAAFASMTVSDDTGSIEAMCFVKEYAELRNRLVEGAVFAFQGTMREGKNKQVREDGTEEPSLVFQLLKIHEIACVHRVIMISFPDLNFWKEKIVPVIKEKYLAKEGYELVGYNMSTGTVSTKKDAVLCVDKSIENAVIPGAIIKLLNVDEYR